MYSKQKLEITDLDESNFTKTLEKCLRFGIPLIIQNVNQFPPMLNSVLSKQTFKTSGRTLIQVGDQQIDFNSNFRLFLFCSSSSV